MIKKIALVLIFLLALSFADPPELQDCPGDCTSQNHCLCGGVELTAPKHCGPDDNAYSSESECEAASSTAPTTPSPPPPWQGIALLAMGVSVTLLAIIFMIGYGFGVNELQFLAKEELYQLLVVFVLIVLLSGTDSLLNYISQTEELKGEGDTLQLTAISSLDNTLAFLSADLDKIKEADRGISIEASKGLQCSVLGVGYSVTGCGGFAMLSTPFSLVGSILGFAIGETYSIQRLIAISTSYSMTLLLPLGIILRTFKITRGAGGLLIAFAISTYILLPMGIIFVDKFGDSFKESLAPDSADYKAYFEPSDVSYATCESGNTMPPVMGSILTGGSVHLDLSLTTVPDAYKSDSNEDRAIGTYYSMRNSISSFLFVILVKATLGPVISVLLMISGIRVLTTLGGAEVDVSALTRLV